MLRTVNFGNNTPNTIILQETPVETPTIILPNQRQSTFATIGSEVHNAVTV